MVPYDIAGLIEIIGGKAVAEKRLDEFFTRLDAGYNDAWFASGNEPSFPHPLDIQLGRNIPIKHRRLLTVY